MRKDQEFSDITVASDGTQRLGLGSHPGSFKQVFCQILKQNKNTHQLLSMRGMKTGQLSFVAETKFILYQKQYFLALCMSTIMYAHSNEFSLEKNAIQITILFLYSLVDNILPSSSVAENSAASAMQEDMAVSYIDFSDA